MPPELEPHEHAERGFALMQAGILGEKTGPPSRDDATLELLFDVVRRSVDPDHGFERPVTLQWEFSDAPAWSVRIDNGSTAARPGLDPAADVTLRCRYEDWVDVVAGRRDPRRLLLTGRLRPRGSLGVLRRMPRLFGA
jgi:alkyl sulfatase BDS1-like metallo-beta-lactamase superfamily hydrolase